MLLKYFKTKVLFFGFCVSYNIFLIVRKLAELPSKIPEMRPVLSQKRYKQFKHELPPKFNTESV